MRYGLGVVMILSSTMLLSPNFPPHRIPLAGPNVSFVWVSFKWLASLLMRCLKNVYFQYLKKYDRKWKWYRNLQYGLNLQSFNHWRTSCAWEDKIPRKGAWLWQGKTTLSNRFKFAFAPASYLGQMRGKVRQIQVNYAGVGVGRGTTLCQLHPCRC